MFFDLCADIGWAYSSAGEHYVDIVGVTGSIPVTPTILFQGLSETSLSPLSFRARAWDARLRRPGRSGNIIIRSVAERAASARIGHSDGSSGDHAATGAARAGKGWIVAAGFILRKHQSDFAAQRL